MRAGHPSSRKKKYRRTTLYILKEKGEKIYFLKIGALLGDLVNKKRCMINYLLD